MDPATRLWWLWSLVGAGVVIVAVAVLLGLIIAAAKRIDTHASRIWTAGKQIAANTVSIWMLEAIKERLERTRDSATQLDRTLQSLNETIAGRRTS